nr:zinc metalloprotease HtpX [Liquorilactobacillus satsumensis]
MLFQQIARNKRRTVYVMIAFFLLVLVIGAAVGYVFFNNSALGIVMAAVLGVFYMLAMLSRSTEIVMGGMNHAEEIQQESDFPELWHVVEDMALVGRVPMPRVFVIADESPNAFATGNNPEHSAVAVTQGLLERLNREELEGVIAHEISHIRNYDIRLQTTALALSAVISALVNLGFNSFWWGGGRRRDNEGGGANAILMVLSIVVVILAPVAATLAQLALSRNREYLADASGVELTRNPQGLINALDKISQSEPMKAADPSSSSLYIANPFKSGSWTHLFDTHPPIEDRIARLRKM